MLNLIWEICFFKVKEFKKNNIYADYWLNKSAISRHVKPMCTLWRVYVSMDANEKVLY